MQWQMGHETMRIHETPCFLVAARSCGKQGGSLLWFVPLRPNLEQHACIACAEMLLNISGGPKGPVKHARFQMLSFCSRCCLSTQTIEYRLLTCPRFPVAARKLGTLGVLDNLKWPCSVYIDHSASVQRPSGPLLQLVCIAGIQCMT